MRRLGQVAAILVAVTTTACVRPAGFAIPSGLRMDLEVVAVPLNPNDPTQDHIGPFEFAGGLQLTAHDVAGLHELSDLVVVGQTFTAVGDIGTLVHGRLVLDGQHRLVDVTDVRVTSLVGQDGAPLSTRDERDAEGLARLPNGDWLVSFERHDRVWRYPAGGGLPLTVPSPPVTRASNEGFEALAADPMTAPDAYVVGIESSAQTWSCRVSTPPCTPSVTVPRPEGFGLVAIRRLPGGLMAYLLRAYDPSRGVRALLTIMRGETVVQQLPLARPTSVDNFEALGIAVRGEVIRFYLLSDDNDSDEQRTLVLAFDWRPGRLLSP